MVEVSIAGDNAVFEVKGMDKLWSLHSRLEIPLAHISGVHTDSAPKMGWFQGLHVTGTELPNIFRAGTFYQDGGWVFWDVRHAENTIVIDLHDEFFKKFVVEVADPQVAIERITRALPRA